MADNYLERRMEDYRNGKLSTRRMTSVSVKRPSMVLRVFVVGGDSEVGIGYVRMFRNHGWKVAFTDPDIKAGRELAQATGSQHHPVGCSDGDALVATMRKAMESWGALDLVVICSDPVGQNIMDAVGSLGIPVIKAY